MTKIKLSFLNLAFKLLCLIGCVYQITKISLEYFSFKTTTKTTFQIDFNVNDPAIVYCTRYTDILDRTNYKKYGIYRQSRFNFTEIFSDNTKLTISDIFHLTPNPNDTIIDCEFRRDEYNAKSYLRDHCYSLFRVTKYLEGPFICYQFQTNDVNSNFKCDQAALAYHGLTVLYRISLNSRFLLSNTLKLISFTPTNIANPILNLPLISRRFYSRPLRYGANEPKKSKHNYFLISGDLYSITRLEKPYDTKCMRNEEYTEFACRRRCNIAAFERHGYFPSTEYTVSPLPIKHINTEALLNKTLLQDTKTQTDICRKICNQKSCSEWFSVTDVSSTEYLRDGLVSIISSCSKRPVVIIQYLPRITLMEFAMYISSSLGIWFGVSFFAINPFKSNQKQCLTTTKQGIDFHFFRQAKCDSTTSFQAFAQDLDRRMGDIEIFREIIRVAVQKLNRKVRQIENK